MWIKSLNSILELGSAFLSEIPLHVTECDILSDVKTTKQELGKLPHSKSGI